MTMLFSLNNRTYAEKGAASPFLATAGDEMAGWTDHFWMSAGRIDGLSGGQLMPPLTILKGTTRVTLYNLLIEFIAEGESLLDLFDVNPEPVRVTRATKDITMPVDTVLTGADVAKPPCSYLTNYIFEFPIDSKYAVRISDAMRKHPEEAVLPYLRFKDGQILTVTKSHCKFTSNLPHRLVSACLTDRLCSQGCGRRR
jgi:hypothetical protein